MRTVKTSLAFLACFLLCAAAVHAEAPPKPSLPPFPESDLPVNETPYHALITRVYPVFKKFANQKIDIPEKTDKLFYSKLSPAGQQALLKRLSLESIDSEKAEKILNLFAGQKINLKKRSSSLHIPAGVDFSSRYTADVTRFTLFKQGVGLRMLHPGIETELLFLPIDVNDLRAYSGRNAGDYEDKSYPMLERSIAAANPPIAANVWLKVFTRGLGVEEFMRLPKEQQRLVVDTVGIYIAEYYRKLARKYEAGEKEDRPGVNFLSILLLERYFSTGGPVLFWYSDADAGKRKEMCEGAVTAHAGSTSWCVRKTTMFFFQTSDYRYRREVRIRNEALKQKFFCREHQALCAALDKTLPAGGPSYLDRLSIQLQQDTPVSTESLNALATYLEFTAQQQDRLRAFLAEEAAKSQPF